MASLHLPRPKNNTILHLLFSSLFFWRGSGASVEIGERSEKTQKEVQPRPAEGNFDSPRGPCTIYSGHLGNGSKVLTPRRDESTRPFLSRPARRRIYEKYFATEERSPCVQGIASPLSAFSLRRTTSALAMQRRQKTETQPTSTLVGSSRTAIA